jgi:hypothetical protein
VVRDDRCSTVETATNIPQSKVRSKSRGKIMTKAREPVRLGANWHKPQHRTR